MKPSPAVAEARPARRRGLPAGVVALVLLAGLTLRAPAQVPATTPATDPPACQLIRLSDIGWTDVTATTAIFSALVHHLGYQTQITVLSVPVTYASMKNRDIDVFLGNWMPAMEADRRDYLASGSVEVIRHNLTGAKYTLAVPAYTYAAGLKSFADIERFAPQLNSAIYGIEPGNDGNRLVLGMVHQNLFGSAASGSSSRANRACWRRWSVPTAPARPSCSSRGTRTR